MSFTWFSQKTVETSLCFACTEKKFSSNPFMWNNAACSLYTQKVHFEAKIERFFSVNPSTSRYSNFVLVLRILHMTKNRLRIRILSWWPKTHKNKKLQDSVVFLEHLGCITLKVLSLKWNGIVLRVVHSSSVIKRWDPTQTTHQQSLYLYLIMVRGCQFGLVPQWSYWLSSQAYSSTPQQATSTVCCAEKTAEFS